MGKEIIIDPEWEGSGASDWQPGGESQFERRRRAAMPRGEQAPAFEVDGVPDVAPFDVMEATFPTPADRPSASPAMVRERRRSRIGEYLGMLLSGSILGRDEARRAYPYMVLVALLMLLYISSVFRMQQLRRHELDLAREVKELRAASIALSARRMAATRQSAILERIQQRELPLEELTTPPKVIRP